MFDNSEEQISYIQLAMSDGIGFKTIEKLLSQYSSASHAIDTLQSISSSFRLNIRSKNQVKKMIEQVELIGGKICTFYDSTYPSLLKSIANPPPILFLLGDFSILKKEKKIAIVGSRNPSLHSIKLSEQISLDLAQRGFVTVSGLAMGIDSTANNVIKHNYPTIAVLANGFNYIYPKQNEEIFNLIKKNGLLISEFFINIPPKPSYFHRRNRLISGISNGCIIIEAGKKSGSLTTAKYAITQERNLFVVPGIPNDSRFAGNNALLRNGAIFTESYKDIIDNYDKKNVTTSFNLSDSTKAYYNQTEQENNIMKIKQKILSLISYLETPTNTVIEHIAQEEKVQDILISMIELEIENKIMLHNGLISLYID
ncbi:DNA-protecting protein DprA [Anaplasmataceae bacterium AB001_6]|nr:DNA-protecting protein DprA [Anaplasmataceae bacterium AB001_6]